jgi:hypothetical protein
METTTPRAYLSGDRGAGSEDAPQDAFEILVRGGTAHVGDRPTERFVRRDAAQRAGRRVDAQDTQLGVQDEEGLACVRAEDVDHRGPGVDAGDAVLRLEDAPRHRAVGERHDLDAEIERVSVDVVDAHGARSGFGVVAVVPGAVRDHGQGRSSDGLGVRPQPDLTCPATPPDDDARAVHDHQRSSTGHRNHLCCASGWAAQRHGKTSTAESPEEVRSRIMSRSVHKALILLM